MTQEALKLARQLLWRYRHEIPIGHQPYMICHQVDEAFESIDEALAQPEQEPVVLRFNEWAVRKNDLSDYICVGELTLAGIEDNLGGPEFGEPEIQRFDDVINALQEKLVIGRECKKVPLIAYIGANDTTPPQRTWVGLTDEEENEYNYLGPDMRWVIQEVAAKLKERNT